MFWRCFVFLIKFMYWSKFHVIIITGSGVMTIFFYKGLTINPEVQNTTVWVFLNIWRLRRVRNTKFGRNISNKMLLNAAKCQGYSFYRFWVIKGKLSNYWFIIAWKYCKEALIHLYWLMRWFTNAAMLRQFQMTTITGGKSIADSWNLVLNSNRRRYFDRQTFNTWALLLL